MEWQETCLVGSLGATKKRLEQTSGVHLEFKDKTLEIIGTAYQLARLYVDLTLQLEESDPSEMDVVDDARILKCTGLLVFEVDLRVCVYDAFYLYTLDVCPLNNTALLVNSFCATCLTDGSWAESMFT